jgi:hypothetical protein
VVGGAHTLLWLPRAFQMRQELRAAEAKRAATPETPASKDDDKDTDKESPDA